LRKVKQNKLEVKGWKVGNASDFFGFSQEELDYIDLKIAPSKI